MAGRRAHIDFLRQFGVGQPAIILQQPETPAVYTVKGHDLIS
jgi:hypothetical protein